MNAGHTFGREVKTISIAVVNLCNEIIFFELRETNQVLEQDLRRDARTAWMSHDQQGATPFSKFPLSLDQCPIQTCYTT
jgi:hypothetical protein